MSDKVYIVTRGEYSDYGIMCAAATREAADEIVAFLNRGGGGDARVEEHELVSSLKEARPRQLWTVYVDATGRETSNSIETAVCTDELYGSERGTSFHPDGWDTTSAAVGQSFRGPQVALKAARDALARRKAEAEGVG